MHGRKVYLLDSVVDERPDLAKALADAGVASDRLPVAASSDETEFDGLPVTISGADDEAPISVAPASGVRPCPSLLLSHEFTGELVATSAARGQLVLPADLPTELLVPVVLRLMQRGDPVGAMARRFGLSPQETKLVRCMVGNHDSEEAAERLGCHATTLSTYWNRVFRKTGTRTQRGVLLLCIDELRRSAL